MKVEESCVSEVINTDSDSTVVLCNIDVEEPPADSEKKQIKLKYNFICLL